MNMYIQVAFSISSRVDLIKKKSQHADCDRLYTKAVLLQKKKNAGKHARFMFIFLVKRLYFIGVTMNMARAYGLTVAIL